MERKYFSISKAIRNACSQYKKDVSEEYETIVNLENKRALNVDDADIVLTNYEMHQRAFPSAGVLQGTTAGVPGTPGGELIKTDIFISETITRGESCEE